MRVCGRNGMLGYPVEDCPADQSQAVPAGMWLKCGQERVSVGSRKKKIGRKEERREQLRGGEEVVT